MRSPVWTALLCLLVVSSAGCAGLSDDGSQATGMPGTTTSGAETTIAETTASTTAAPEQLAPGVTTDGVTDALALADAHRDTLEEHPFVKHARIEHEKATSTAIRQTTLQYADESHWRWNQTAEGRPVALGVTNGTLVQYADGDEVRYVIRSSDDVRYGVRNTSVQDGTTAALPPEDVLREYVFARNVVYTLFAGSDVTVERGDDVAARVTGTASELTVSGHDARNVEFTATVTADGVVQSLDLSYDVAGSGQYTVERTLTFETTASNPVQRPEWYSEAGNSSE